MTIGEDVDNSCANLHATMDAQVWAKDFIRMRRIFNVAVDEDLMRAWFANAIMCGYDHGRKQATEDYLFNSPNNLRQSIDRVGERLERIEEIIDNAPYAAQTKATTARVAEWAKENLPSPVESFVNMVATRHEAGGYVPPPGAGYTMPDGSRVAPKNLAAEMYPDSFGPQEAEAMAQKQRTTVATKTEGYGKCPVCGTRGVVRTMGGERRQVRCERGHWFYE